MAKAAPKKRTKARRKSPLLPIEAGGSAPAREAGTLAFWKKAAVFQKSLQRTKKGTPYVFFEGPPTANGTPHPGHVLTRVMKDVIPRYRTMCGFHVTRKAGWDTHGLPVEIEVEKQLGISGKPDIERHGVAKFIKQCRQSVWKYLQDWRRMTERIGMWLDLDDPYVTYDRSYIESVWWALHTIREKGLLFRGHKSVPWCPRCGTGLSSHEVGLGYRDVTEESVYVGFRLKSDPFTLIVAWTTTPWTLPSNAALAVRPDVRYARVRVGDEVLLIAHDLVERTMGKIPHDIVGMVMGERLVGLEYEPLYALAKHEERAHHVVAADFVTLDSGTGVVHIAPGYGEDDSRVGREHGLPVIQLVGADGRFTPESGPFAGQPIKDADRAIVTDLRERKLLLRTESVTHSYPHCWRCKSPLYYFARPAWFIKTTAVKDRLLANNRDIGWIPEHIGTGRFGNFLETNVDWALSRERYWGTPLNIWVCEGCGAEESFPSLAALRKRNPKIPASLDLHKPAIDRATVKCRACGKTARRVPEVIDCWFDSGAMPFAQWGYPHQGKREFEAHFPADFICEAIDQTRGWFYSLLAISTLLFDRSPYKNCVVLGHVLDDKGVKMSKHLGNYLDPAKVLDTHGADALRWYFASANQPWTSVRFAEKAVGEAAGEFLLTLRNVAHFFSSYAALDGFDPARGVGKVIHGDHRDWTKARGFVPLAERPLLDRWIGSLLQGTVAAVRESLDRLDTYGGARALAEFVDALSNWYVRRSRARFWGAADTADKRAAHQTLYEALAVLARLAAPFTPFVAEDLHAALVRAPFKKKAAASVHLESFPTPDPAWRDEALEARMAAVRQVVSIGHAARRDHKLRVRQPLAALTVIADKARADAVRNLADLVADELNVKQVTIADDVTQFAVINVRPNFRVLGPKLGPRVGDVARLLGDLPASARADAAAGRPVQVLDGTEILTLGPDELDVRLTEKEGFATGAGGGMVVALDTAVTSELRAEGLAREVISRIQGMRKELALGYEARIRLTAGGGGALGEALDAHRDLIMRETLAVDLVRGQCHGDLLGEFTIDEFELNLGVAPVGADGRVRPASRRKPARARATKKPARRAAARK